MDTKDSLITAEKEEVISCFSCGYKKVLSDIFAQLMMINKRLYPFEELHICNDCAKTKAETKTITKIDTYLTRADMMTKEVK